MTRGLGNTSKQEGEEDGSIGIPWNMYKRCLIVLVAVFGVCVGLVCVVERGGRMPEMYVHGARRLVPLTLWRPPVTRCV